MYPISSIGTFIGLVVHISLAVQRLRNGETISMEQDVLNELKSIEQFKTATKIAQQIEEEFDIKVLLMIYEQPIL